MQYLLVMKIEIKVLSELSATNGLHPRIKVTQV